ICIRNRAPEPGLLGPRGEGGERCEGIVCVHLGAPCIRVAKYLCLPKDGVMLGQGNPLERVGHPPTGDLQPPKLGARFSTNACTASAWPGCRLASRIAKPSPETPRTTSLWLAFWWRT